MNQNNKFLNNTNKLLFQLKTKTNLREIELCVGRAMRGLTRAKHPYKSEKPLNLNIVAAKANKKTGQ